MSVQKETHLPKIRCTKDFRHQAYKLAQSKGMRYSELVRFLIRKEIEK